MLKHPILFLLIFTATLYSETRTCEIGKIVQMKTSDKHAFNYDIYLPKQYENKSTYLPMIFTANSGGGGMTKAYTKVADKLGIILVGNKKYKNGENSCGEKTVYLDTIWEDVDKWVRYNPSKVITAGVSGGGLNSFGSARKHQERVAAVYSVGGWLGNQYDDTAHRFSEGLVVARGNGLKDTAARSWLVGDKKHLDKFACIISDFDHPGGHCDSTTEAKEEALSWILSNLNDIPNDQMKALSLKRKWVKTLKRSPSSVLWNCLDIIDKAPRSWQFKCAVQMLNKIMKKDKLVAKYSLPSKLRKSKRINDFLIQKALINCIKKDEELSKSYLHLLLDSEVIKSKTCASNLFVMVMATYEKPFRDGGKLIKILRENSSTDNDIYTLMASGLLAVKTKKWDNLAQINEKLKSEDATSRSVKSCIKQLEQSEASKTESIVRSDWITAFVD